MDETEKDNADVGLSAPDSEESSDLNASPINKTNTNKKKYLLGSAGTSFTPIPQKEALKFEPSTLSQAMDGVEFQSQADDYVTDFPEWAKNQSYLNSFSGKGMPLTQKQYAESAYARPGLSEKYPNGVSTDYAKELAHEYDLKETIDAQLANMPAYQRLTAEGLANTVTYVRNPLNLLGGEVFGLAKIGGTIAKTLSKVPLIRQGLDTVGGRILGSGAEAAGSMGFAAAANTLPHAIADNQLNGPYSFLNAAKDTLTQSAYGAALGAGGHALVAEPLSALFKKSLPSASINEGHSGEEIKQAAEDFINSAKAEQGPTDKVGESYSSSPEEFKKTSVPFQDLPDDLKAKYSSTTMKDNASLSELKQVHLEGSDKKIGPPTDTMNKVDEQKKQLNEAIDQHNAQFSEIKPEELDKLYINDLPEELFHKSEYLQKKYVKSDESLPYVVDALKYLKNPDEFTAQSKKAYDAIKSGDEAKILEEYMKRTKKNILTYEENGDKEKLNESKEVLNKLNQRKAQLGKLNNFKKSLDNIHRKLNDFLRDRPPADKIPGFGQKLIPDYVDTAILNKADADRLLNRDIDIRGHLKVGLSDSPLLGGKDVPESMDDLKSHANTLVPTTEDIRSDYTYSKMEGSEPPLTEKELREEEENVARAYENLPKELKEEFPMEDPVFFHGIVGKIFNCLLGK